jgi:hypothetical protein
MRVQTAYEVTIKYYRVARGDSDKPITVYQDEVIFVSADDLSEATKIAETYAENIPEGDYPFYEILSVVKRKTVLVSNIPDEEEVIEILPTGHEGREEGD